MKKLLLLITLMGIISSTHSQESHLAFNPQGKFKIVQFTDVHYKQGRPESKVAIQLIEEVLDAEKPDLVVFTGDIIWAEPVKLGLDEVFAPVVKRKIPWAYVFGNHDDEFGVSRSEIMDYVVQKPYCLAQAGDKNVKGVGNYIIELKDPQEANLRAVLYFMDSGSYSPIKGIGGYNWFDFSQINWFREKSAAYTKANDEKPFPALAFFHIPLYEYEIIKKTKKAELIGHSDETECNGRLSSGMFAAMKEAGDIMGVFTGHDHNNDYISEYYGIALAYGRYSGGKTVYNDLGLNGCRVIELEEGKREFSTYIRLLGGEKLFPVKYPQTLMKEDKK